MTAWRTLWNSSKKFRGSLTENDFDKNFPMYCANLKAAGEDFSPVNFARRLEKIIRQE